MTTPRQPVDLPLWRRERWRPPRRGAYSSSEPIMFSAAYCVRCSRSASSNHRYSIRRYVVFFRFAADFRHHRDHWREHEDAVQVKHPVSVACHDLYRSLLGRQRQSPPLAHLDCSIHSYAPAEVCVRCFFICAQYTFSVSTWQSGLKLSRT